jgi:membrane protease subunit HflK
MTWDNGNQGPWGRRPSSSSENKKPRKPQDNPQEELDELIRKSQEKIKRLFPGGRGPNNQNTKLPAAKLFTFVATLAGLLWLATGFYRVGTDEQAVVLRFGEYSRTTNPGLNYHLPYPIERVTTLSVTRINQEEIGSRPSANAQNYAGRSVITGGDRSLKERLMLTWDSNVVDVNFVVQWRIKNAQNYLFNIRNDYNESTVKSAAESAIREVIGRMPLESVLAKERSRIEVESQNILQNILDSYLSGIEIVRVQMLDSDPPEEVLDAFRNVEAARAEKETKKNEAERERNKIIPEARGQARQLIEEALAYKEEVIARAKGEADRFTAVYNEYKNAKEVTKQRIYLETMEDVLADMQKIVVEGKGITPYLPLQGLNKAGTETATTSAKTNTGN